MMKKLFFVIGLWMLSFGVSAQEISGDWYGVLEFPGARLRLVFHITHENGQYQASLDSPDQGTKGIPASMVRYVAPELEIQFAALHAEYKGIYDNGKLKGTFTQMNHPIALNLDRQEITVKRPQEPQPPYPYHREEVAFENRKAGISLAGTLTLPQKEGNFPAVVLISGSGPQNRDEELMGHKPFLVLADYLTRQGIAVLRFDDRGVGQSGGVYAQATTLDFATDVEAAVDYLKTRKEIQQTSIGLVGHSEGGIIAPVVASRDQEIAYIVLLAGVGVPGKDLLLQQSADLLRAGNASPEEIQRTVALNRKTYDLLMTSPDHLASQVLDSLWQSELPFLLKEKQLSQEQKEQFIQQQIRSLLSPWFKGFLTFVPEKYLARVKCPVLALNGKKDVQVNARQNLTAIYEILQKNGNNAVDTLYLPDLNHLFQKCHTGVPAEYAFIQETFSPEALKLIADWIHKQ